MTTSRRIALAALLTGCTFFAQAHPPEGDHAALVTKVLTVGGRVNQPLSLTLEDLAKLPSQTLADIPVRGKNGEVSRILKAYTGVKLTDILSAAGLVSSEPNDLKKTVFVATASDNYKAVFSWNELYNSMVGDGVLVLYARDGKPLDDDEGRIALISTTDRHTGPRHVRWLKDIRVQKID